MPNGEKSLQVALPTQTKNFSLCDNDKYLEWNKGHHRSNKNGTYGAA